MSGALDGRRYREFLAWTDLNVVVYMGGKEDRDTIRTYEFFYDEEEGRSSKRSKRAGQTKFQVIITTPEM
jgi:chromodomain-helicase-DNA-binding protein 7